MLLFSLITLGYLLAGLISGTIGYKLENGECPSRLDALQMTLAAPIAVAYLLWQLSTKYISKDWWDKPIC